MSDDKLTLALRLIAENSVFKAVIGNSQTTVNRFVTSSKAQIESLSRALHSTLGKVGIAGLGAGAFALARGAAMLDQHLTRIGLSAGKSKVEIKDLREQIQGLSVKTGQDVGQLADGFNKLFSLTGDWDIAKKSIESVNTAVKVTGANTDLLAESLSIAQTSFGKDLSKPGASSEILNKLGAIAPGAGGLQNVAGIFNSIAPMAALSGMNFDSAVKLIGMISQVTKNPEQMGELANQSLRLFTNIRAITNKKGTLGKVVFDESGNRRDPLEILKGIKTLYDSLSAKKQVGLLTALTGGADPRSTRIIQMLMKSDALDKGADIQKKLDASTGNFERKLPQSIDNAVDQSERLKNLLAEAGEGLARPIDRALAKSIQFAMDKGKLSGLDIAGLGTAAGLTAWLGGSMFKGALGKFLGGKASLAGGVMEGAALSRVGVTSVYVVNFGEMSNAMNNPVTGKFQEFLPAEIQAAVGGISAATIASIAGVVVISVGALAASIWAATQEKYRKGADAIRGTTNLQGGVASGGGFNPDELWRASHSGLDYSGNSGSPNSPSSVLHHETHVTVFVDNEKKKPTKTIVDNRGSFTK
jgi:Phage-related minor tail protein